MRSAQYMLLGATSLTAFIFASALPAGAADNSLLSGKVSSAEEGAMEGVLVTASKAGSTIDITVVTNDKGEYAFPASKVGPGKYKLTTRAIGYQGGANVEV